MGRILTTGYPFLNLSEEFSEFYLEKQAIGVTTDSAVAELTLSTSE